MMKFAVVGAGFWAGYQLAAWGEIPGVRCVALCDPDRAKAEKLAAAHQVPAVYADAAEMIDRERPEFLDIIAAVAAHGPLVRLAAARKVPVICQKPMAERLEECEALVALCRDAGVPFAIHENWRWQAPMRRVKELLAQGAIGKPFRCRIDMMSGFDVFANQPSLRLEKNFRFRTSQRVAVRLDLYNALNVNTALAISPRSGERFLRPEEIVPPRIAEFGMTYGF